MSKTIQFISGKGGTGKTAVSIATAQLLAASGSNVAIYDLDISTHGLTHYFSALLTPSRPGLSETANSRETQYLEISASDTPGRVVVYPSVGDLANDWSDSSIAHLIQNAASLSRDPRSPFDFHIFDLQAGLTPVMLELADIVDASVIVTEADPVSIGAVTAVRKVLEAHLREPSTLFGIVNRALPGEEPYFESLVDYVQQVTWLGILPLDPSVRHAFFRRKPLFMPRQGGAFELALRNALAEIDPSISDTLERGRVWIEAPGASLQGDRESLVKMRDDLEDRLAFLHYRSERVKLTYGLASSVALIAAVLGVILYVQDSIPATLGYVTGGLGLLTATFARVYAQLRTVGHATLDEARLRRELSRVQEQLASYDIASYERTTPPVWNRPTL